MTLDFAKEAIENCPKAIPKIELEGFEEISQGEYHRLKREDPHNVNGYTARIAFKHFKKKQEFPIVFEEGDFKICLNKREHVTGFKISILDKRNEHTLYFDYSLHLLIKAVDKIKELQNATTN